MAILGWMAIHWFDLLQTGSIVGGLSATAYSIRANTKQRKVETLLALTASHRDLWKNLFDRPQFWRILNREVDVNNAPPNGDEKLFVHLLILHIRAAFKARKSDLQFDDDDLATDLRDLFTRPIVRMIWEDSKTYQDPAFVAFVESNFAGDD